MRAAHRDVFPCYGAQALVRSSLVALGRVESSQTRDQTRVPCTSRWILFFFFLNTKSLTTPWTVAHQAPLSMGFSRQEYLSGLPFPSWSRWVLNHWTPREVRSGSLDPSKEGWSPRTL